MRNAWVGFLGWCLFLQSPGAGAQQFAQPGGSERGEIPFRLSAGFLIEIEGRIGTLDKLNFILDTGSTRSIVDRKVAAKLGLVRHSRQMFDFDRFTSIEWAVFPDVQFGPVDLANVSMSVADLAHFSTFARHVDVLLGSDFLSLNAFTIDYDSKRVQFTPQAQATHEYAESSRPPLLTVELQVQGQLVCLLVDTGFPDVLLFEDRLLQRVRRLKLDHVIGGFRIGGRLRAKKATLPLTRLGERTGDLRVLLTEAPPDNVLPGIDGILGVASLNARRIHFNYATNTLDWR